MALIRIPVIIMVTLNLISIKQRLLTVTIRLKNRLVCLGLYIPMLKQVAHEEEMQARVYLQLSRVKPSVLCTSMIKL
jgi:hypothetical protein